MNNRVYQGHLARKRFGQNFLHDPFIIDNIVTAFNPQPGQSIIEIGPGLGALTVPVAQRAGHLSVIELDRDLSARLQERTELAGKITLYQQDALLTDYRQFTQQSATKLRIFGNLPYNISTPLMFRLFSYADVIADMYFMLQKEVVDRLLATPGDQNYGRLSVMTQYYCEVNPVLEVPPSSFSPPPKVDSGVVCLQPYASPPHLVPDLRLLSRITAIAFNQRRKTLRNSLASLINASELISMDINPVLRAQNITVGQYCRMACFLADKLPASENSA